jgi:benzoyl-CoA reductase subunit A
MSLYLGIDLGSTTTKAVLLDEDEHILGRGITNTRSDYHVATSVAENEAHINARFTLLSRNADEAGLDPKLLETLLSEFTVESALYRLRRLRDFAFEHDGNGAPKQQLHDALAAVFGRIERDLTENPEVSARIRNSFFRDIVGALFMAVAEEEAPRFGLDFEDLMAVYDSVILREENTVLDIDFGGTLKRCPTLTGLSGDRGVKLTGAIDRAAAAPLDVANMVGTGYGRQRLPFRKDQIRSEILCHGLGAHFFFPKTRTVLDIGGQDTKAIQVDDRGISTNFQMNDRCAAGCGRYLGYIADELSLSLDELGPLALTAAHPVTVSSTCTVFAGAEIRERLELGQKREDILLGLHRAIVLRAMSLLARSGGINEEFTFTGGVARNPAVVASLKDLVETNYGKITLNIHPDSIYTGAVGAALYARRDIPVDETALEVKR